MRKAHWCLCEAGSKLEECCVKFRLCEVRQSSVASLDVRLPGCQSPCRILCVEDALSHVLLGCLEEGSCGRKVCAMCNLLE